MEANTEPYIKMYNNRGTLINPITKKKPYITSANNRKKRREKETKDKPGKMYIVGINKSVTYLQIIPESYTWDEGDKYYIYRKAKRIVHYK
jgi:hypothetical protein